MVPMDSPIFRSALFPNVPPFHLQDQLGSDSRWTRASHRQSDTNLRPSKNDALQVSIWSELSLWIRNANHVKILRREEIPDEKHAVASLLHSNKECQCVS